MEWHALEIENTGRITARWPPGLAWNLEGKVAPSKGGMCPSLSHDTGGGCGGYDQSAGHIELIMATTTAVWFSITAHGVVNVRLKFGGRGGVRHIER